jgi:hypothetical protein
MSESSSSSSMSSNDITVMFLLERDSKTGQELLTSMTPMLQQTLQQAHTTPKQYSHVSGVESGAHVLKKCKAATTATSNMNPVLVNLNELGYKLNHTLLSSSSSEKEMIMDVLGDATLSLPPVKNNKATVKKTKRNRMIEASNFVIVTVPHNIPVDVLDATVVQTIQHEHVQTIVLSSVRSVQEVKYERQLSMKRQLLDKAIIVDSTTAQTTTTTTDPYHRRLDQQNNNNNYNYGTNLSGTYYVQMTPNIFSGLLFFGMFTVIAMIGVSCMNMITGQDVYVSTMPSIGREA